jgi:hypothetical protein
MIGGIIAATALTLVFLPALYVAWYRIKEPVRPAGPLGAGQAPVQGLEA